MDPQVTSSLIGGASSIGATLLNQAFAEHNRERNFYWNEKAANSADKRQRAQYQDLYSPQAQVQQLKEAGLSPSTMYGGAGSAGQSAGNMSMGATGIQGPYLDPLAAAQIANIKADTKGKEIDNENKEDLILSNIAKNLADAGHKKASKELLEQQTLLEQVKVGIASATAPYEIELYMHKASIAYHQSQLIEKQVDAQDWANKWTKETFVDRVNQVNADYKLTIAQAAKTLAEKELTEEQTAQLSEYLANAKYEAATKRLSAEAQRDFYREQVNQWAKENGFTEQELKQEKTKNWINFAANLYGSTINAVATAVPF